MAYDQRIATLEKREHDLEARVAALERVIAQLIDAHSVSQRAVDVARAILEKR